MKAKEIIELNQILSLEDAQDLIGKKIAVTNEEYRGNEPMVRQGTVIDIVSEWDRAAKDESTLPNFPNRQEYWKSYMTASQIKEKQEKLVIVADNELYCRYNANWNFFYGSDSDRPIYYVEITE